MNKKIILLIAIALLQIIFFTNVIQKYVFTKQNIQMTYQEVIQICQNPNLKCHHSINIENIKKKDFEKIKNIKTNIDITNHIILTNIFKTICLTLMFGFLIFYYTKHKKENNDIKYSNWTLILFALGASYKFIHLYFHNLSKIPFITFLLAIFLSISTFFILYYLFKLIFKNQTDSICFSLFLTSVLLFSRNFFISELSITFPFYVFDNYFCIGLLVLFLFTILFLSSAKILTFFKYYIIAILTLCIFNSTFQFFSTTFNFTNNKKEIKKLDKKIEFDKNVYIILLDMYAGNKTLEYLDFDNSEFFNKLTNENFMLIKNIDSNYSRTILSLSSFLNFDFIENLPYYYPTEAVKNAKLFNIFKSLGYKIFYRNAHGYGIHITSKDFDFVFNDDSFTYLSSYHFMFEDTVFYPLLKMFSMEKTKEYFFEKVFSCKDKKLVFAHYMMPHPPYLFDENGNQLKEKFDIPISHNKKILNKKNYLSFLKYANKETEKIIQNIKNHDPNSIIIIMGDHGPELKRFYDGEDKHTEEINEDKINMIVPFNTFIAYYNPDLKQEYYKSANSLVNFMRMFANENLNYNFSLLKNRKFYLYSSETQDRIKDIKGLYVEK